MLKQEMEEMRKSQKQYAVPVESAPKQRSEIFHVLAQITAQLAMPPQKAEDYAKVFETHEIYSKSALAMLPEDELKSIASECKMGTPAQQCLIKIWN